MEIVKNLSSVLTLVHIYNAQTKGIQQKSMVMPALKGRGLHLPGNSKHCKLLMHSERYFRDMNYPLCRVTGQITFIFMISVVNSRSLKRHLEVKSRLKTQNSGMFT